ncbi:RASA family extended-spectrum class A beta-lactamase [Riemerella anatipestifer]|uniref:RASA family extended-spectrum class A beta-lactamase n=1 Tax=Riemerella anatipestifer TaxID=34085 RepID=UPI0028599D43|nr:RASA family extended-spectrum class A beta-lactamase [Riemerella anatipestifer]MDR7673112.1 RASA family extended-spectrum class A beta-lactamase [Riemerella anatipestifer]MDR7693110.1 RASA family extended-spectrum class A beta-lactamase [Riemerella anatipestifer]MDR7699869.1 RASA family extended-spectrum class A beta-lactamase [Riemerella anatipestifer]MDR7709580.1 RASA family extended-spectrum class A beta-lactamase [Riemerella anatipestifer]MDR7721703.1 RASA family extended-spectrum class
MNTLKLIIISFTFLIINSCATVHDNNLKNQIEKIISSKKGDFGISIIDENNNIIEINGNKSYPLLSTFKFPIALTTLHKVENGELSMQQQIFIKKEELLENTWSPFKEKYPNGNISISLEEALNWMIVYSDNNMTDILLRLIGGTNAVEKFIDDENFVIKNNEDEMHKDWNSQFINKSTPNSFTKLLKNFSEGKILNSENTKWLYESMVNSKTGVKRLKGKLPNVKIAQRAGTSFTNDDGITGAINNVGIIQLPNNQKIYITVFIHNTSEEFKKGEEIIADIAKTAYEFYTKE